MLDWPDLWRYAKLARFPRLFFDVPERDGETCDDACLGAVLARASAHGGKLSGTLTVVRSFGDRHNADGTCTRVIQEMVTLDLRKATHGIAPDLESSYGFLELGDGEVPSVDVQDIPCP